MNRQQRQGTDILFTDLPAGPKSCKDHFIKLLSGEMAYRIIIQFYCAGAFCAACHAIHILSTDSTDGFQRIDHTVYCSYTDLRIQCGSPVIDFLTTGALSLQDNVQKNLSLSGDAEPLLLQFLYNKIPLHLCMSVASCFFLFCFGFCNMHSDPSFIEKTFLLSNKLVYSNLG